VFQLSFGRINPGSLAWRRLLEPVKAEMEQTIAQMAGAPYKARNVKVQLPDFVDSASLALEPAGAEAGLMSTVLHEAAHNLGPAHQYKIAGALDTETFGGPLATLLQCLRPPSLQFG